MRADRPQGGAAQARIERGAHLIDLGRHGDALAELAPLLADDPHHLAAGCLAAHALFELDRAPEALTVLHGVAHQWPYSGLVLEGLARGYSILGEHARAIDFAQRAVAVEPGRSSRHQQLARTLLAAGRRDEAIAVAQEAVRLSPNRPAPHLVLALALYPEGSRPTRRALAVAEQHVRIALELNPDSAYAHNELARIRLVQGKALQAATHLIAAVGADPHQQAPQENMDLVFLRVVQLAHWTVVADGSAFLVIAALGPPRWLASALALAVVVASFGWLWTRLRRAVPRHLAAFLRGFARRDRLGVTWATLVALPAVGLLVTSVGERSVLMVGGLVAIHALVAAVAVSWLRALVRR